MQYPIDLVFWLRILNILIHTQDEREGLKETDSCVYPKWPNSWIHNICFKPL